MNWEDEPYVRIYTRDTANWLDLPFQARLLFYEIERKVDRVGCLEFRTYESLARVLLVPVDFLKAGLPALFEDGCIEPIQDGARAGLIVPNFVEAQEAVRSDKLRQAERRRKMRDASRSSSPSRDVTTRPLDAGWMRDVVTTRDTLLLHAQSRSVTNGLSRSVMPETDIQELTPPPVTSRDAIVTPPLARDRARKQSKAEEAMQSNGGEGGRGPGREGQWDFDTAMVLWQEEQRYRRLLPGAPPLPPLQPALGELERGIAGRLRAGWTEEHCRHVLRFRAGEVALNAEKVKYFQSVTLWGGGFDFAVGASIDPRAEAALAKLERVARGEPAAPPRAAAVDPVAVVENKPTQEEIEAFQAATAKFFGLNIPVPGQLVGEAETAAERLLAAMPPLAEHPRVAADPAEHPDQPDASDPPATEIEVDLDDLSDPATPHQSATSPLERASGTPVAALPDEGLENAS